jgi:hypothetical protein
LNIQKLRGPLPPAHQPYIRLHGKVQMVVSYTGMVNNAMAFTQKTLSVPSENI